MGGQRRYRVVCLWHLCTHMHTHTHMLKELPLYLPLPPSREERFATFHPHPTRHYLLLRYSSGSFPCQTEQAAAFIFDIRHCKKKTRFGSTGEAWMVSNTIFWLNDQKQWVITCTLRVWSDGGCFGSVTYQLRKTLMVDSFAWLLDHLILHSAHPSRAAFVPPFQSCLWFSKVQCWVFTLSLPGEHVSAAWTRLLTSMHVLKGFTLKKRHDFNYSSDFAEVRLRINWYWTLHIYEKCIERVNASIICLKLVMVNFWGIF